jgi:hypothetical protein
VFVGSVAVRRIREWRSDVLSDVRPVLRDRVLPGRDGVLRANGRIARLLHNLRALTHRRAALVGRPVSAHADFPSVFVNPFTTGFQHFVWRFGDAALLHGHAASTAVRMFVRTPAGHFDAWPQRFLAPALETDRLARPSPRRPEVALTRSPVQIPWTTGGPGS